MSKKWVATFACLMTVLASIVLFIWINSCRPPAQSGAQSGAVFGSIQKILDAIFGKGKVVVDHLLIRKLAHLFEFFVLGIALCAVFTVSGALTVKYTPVAFLFGVTVAFIDEGIQALSGRVSLIQDVLIDVCGVVAAIIAYLAIYLFIKAVKCKKLKKKK